METLDNAWYGSLRPLTNLTQTFRACHLCTWMWLPFFWGVIPTYGVLLYAMIQMYEAGECKLSSIDLIVEQWVLISSLKYWTLNTYAYMYIDTSIRVDLERSWFRESWSYVELIICGVDHVGVDFVGVDFVGVDHVAPNQSTPLAKINRMSKWVVGTPESAQHWMKVNSRWGYCNQKLRKTVKRL